MTVWTAQQDGLSFLLDNVERGTQSWTRRTTVTWGGHKIRTTIKRDSYDFQSQIYSEVFNPRDLAWNRLESLSGTDYADLPSYVVRDEVAIIAATNDLMNRLIGYAQQILEGVPA